MKRLLGCFMLALCAFAGRAADGTPNVICIDRTDGVRETLQLDPAMVVKFLPENIVINHPAITIEYDLSEVATFTYQAVENAELYDGDHQAGLDEVAAPDKNVEISGEAITVGGTDDIVLYDLRGIERARAASDGSAAALSLRSLPKGVYILKSGTLTLKVTL